MRRLIPSYVLAVFLPLFAGCGVYSFNPRGSSDIKAIAVEPLQNETPEFGLADALTEVIIDQFIADGNLKVVSAAQADAVLVGTLLSYERVAETFDQNDQVQTYKVILNFDIGLKKADGEEDIWRDTLRMEGIYDANEQIEEDGQRIAGARLVEEIINRTTKSW
jgi:hypothetical protein